MFTWKNPQRWVITVFATGLVLVYVTPAAWAAGNIANGRAIAREQCSNCHVVDKYHSNAQESQPIGPDFTAIKGVTAGTLKSRLNKPHPIMSQFPALTDQQIDDLVAYIAWVKD
jgi:mono/diheme cytochrome c family protein